MTARSYFRGFKGLSWALWIFVVCGCQIKGGTSTAGSRLKILSTIAPIEVLVSAVAGGRVDSECLIVGELDPHSYQLVKGDQEKMRRASIVFYLGLGLEHGPSLAASLTTVSKGLCLGQWLLEQRPKSVLHSGGSPDPHLWMDIALWSSFLEPICQELTRLLPHHGEEFQMRAQRIRQEFHETHARVREDMQRIPGDRRYLVTTHDAFRYFARAYLAEAHEMENEVWAQRVMSPEGLAPESQTSLQQMQRTLQYLMQHRVPVVFAESNVNHQSLSKIVQSARSKQLPLRLAKERIYGDTMPPYVVGPLGYRAYLEMIASNAKIILANLTPQKDA